RRLRRLAAAVRRDAPGAANLSRHRRAGRERRPREPVRRQGGPEPLAGQAPGGAGLGDEPGRPPARRRRGQVEGRPPSGDAVGRADARQAHASQAQGSEQLDRPRPPSREGEALSVEIVQEGALRGGAPDEADRGDEHLRQQADAPHLVAHLDDLPGNGRAHDRRPRRPQARARVHLRADGRPQARRVRADTDLPRSRRRSHGKGEALMAVAEQERDTVRAQARWVHSSARKARLVTDLIRGRSVPEARTILAFSNRAVAKDVEKVLRSAVANAESRPDLHWAGDDLVVAAAYADEGPTLKRWRARARGRVARIRKRTCHITIELVQGLATSTAPSVPAMAAPEPVEEPEAVEEPETVDEAEVEETETAEEPEAVEETEEPAAETETDEPEAEAETPETESPSAEAEAEASTKETDR